MTTRVQDPVDRSKQITLLASITAGVALAAVVALTAFGGGGRGNDGAAVPPPPAASPSAPAKSPEPAPDPTPGPSDDGSDAMPIKVDLENVTGADVYVDIVDRSGRLVDARSGTPDEGVSVDSYKLEVENVDPSTLRLTWSDYPIDNALALYIDESEGGIRLVLVQPEPTGPTDTIALDRELILSFSEPISADDVEPFLQDGLDTPG